MSTVVVKKKVPKRISTRDRKKLAKKKKQKRRVLHPIDVSQLIREPRPPSPLMEFIHSLDGELEYREAIIEFQNEWCDHPASHQTVSTTLYAPSAERYEYDLKCEDCGIIRRRQGRAPSGRT